MKKFSTKFNSKPGLKNPYAVGWPDTMQCKFSWRFRQYDAVAGPTSTVPYRKFIDLRNANDPLMAGSDNNAINWKYWSAPYTKFHNLKTKITVIVSTTGASPLQGYIMLMAANIVDTPTWNGLVLTVPTDADYNTDYQRKSYCKVKHFNSGYGAPTKVKLSMFVDLLKLQGRKYDPSQDDLSTVYNQANTGPYPFPCLKFQWVSISAGTAQSARVEIFAKYYTTFKGRLQNVSHYGPLGDAPAIDAPTYDAGDDDMLPYA